MFSPNKTTSFECDFTPGSKREVDCEINGWMETCKKKELPAPRHPNLTKGVSESENERRVKFAKLREFRSSLIKQAMRKHSERTPITADSNTQSISSKSPKPITSRLPSVDRQARSKRVDISEFTLHQTHEIINVNEQTKIAMLKLPELSNRGNAPTINRYLLGMDPSIIQNKITQRHYRASKFIIQKYQYSLHI